MEALIIERFRIFKYVKKLNVMSELMRMIIIDTMDEKLETTVVNIILGETVLRLEESIIYLN